MFPKEARFEAEIAGGIALYDVVDALPKHPTKTYDKRPLEAIERVYVHHSGKLGSPCLKGAQNSARYSVESLGWPGGAYHYWLPYYDRRDREKRMVVFRMNYDDTRCYHTGGEANTHGIGIVLQGNCGSGPMSYVQKECLQALLPWLRERHNLSGEWLSWHSDSARFGGSGKHSCPGRHAVAWLLDYRSRLKSEVA